MDYSYDRRTASDHRAAQHKLPSDFIEDAQYVGDGKAGSTVYFDNILDEAEGYIGVAAVWKGGHKTDVIFWEPASSATAASNEAHKAAKKWLRDHKIEDTSGL